MSLTTALIAEKNKLFSPNPWITLIDFQYTDVNWLYFTNFPSIHKYYKNYHNDYQGDWTKLVYPHPSGTEFTYKRFSLGKFTEESGGKMNNLSLSFDNVDREMEFFLQTNELRGKSVTVRRTNLNLLASDTHQRTDHYIINTIASDTKTVTFSLGHASIIQKEYGNILIKQCEHDFGDAYCKYSPVGVKKCSGFLGEETDIEADETCRGYDNEINFGGYIWMRSFLE